MAIQVFDIDYDLEEDSSTKDLTVLYNEDAINQSIDVWISVPYRIGVGYTNSLINQIFIDIQLKTEIDLARIIQEEFERNYYMLKLRGVIVESDPNNRRVYVSISWELRDYPEISGTYQRYWNT